MRHDNSAKKHNTSYFTRIFSIMTLCSFSILLVAMVFSFFSSKNAALKQISSNNQKFLQNVNETISYKNSYSQVNANTIFSTTQYAAILLSKKEATPYDVTVNMREIDQNLMFNPSIFSIYLYNGYTDNIYMMGKDKTYSSLNNFFDTEIISHILEPVHGRSGPYARQVAQTPYSWENTNVYTYVTRTVVDNKVSKALVVNILIDELFAILESPSTLYDTISNYYVVYTEDGSLLYSTLPAQSTATDGISYVWELLQHSEEQASFKAALNGENFLCTPMHDSINKWHIVALSPLADVVTNSNYLLTTFAAIFVIALMLGLLLIFALSKFLYQPIGNLRQALHKSSFTSFEVNSSNELAYISQSIQKATDTLDKLFKYKEQSLSFGQASLLREQLINNRYSNEEFWQKCSEQELGFEKNHSFLLIYASRASGNEQARTIPEGREQLTINYAICNVFYELMQPLMTVHHVPLDNNDLVFVCGFSGKPHTNVAELLKSIQLTFLEYFSIQLSFVVSPCIESPAHLNNKLKALKHINEYGFFQDEAYIIYTEEFDEEFRKPEQAPLPDFSLLEQALRKASNNDAYLIVDNYLASLPNYRIETAHASLGLFYVRFNQMLKKIDDSLPAPLPAEILDNLLNLSQMKRLSEVHSGLNTIIDLVCSHILDVGEESLTVIIDKVIRYINEDYGSFNLSNKSIADDYRISVNHLNNHFKQRTGLSVSAYIKKTRLEKAAQMLSETNTPVENIARRVGFENTKYFYTLFKQEYGVSPAAYRQNNAINKD